MAAEKAAWRERFRHVRQSLAAEVRAEASAQIARRLAEVVGERLDGPADTVALFWPLPGEVDLRALAESLRASGVTVALPAVAGRRQLAWRAFEGTDHLADGPWGLREPADHAAPVDPARLAVVAVPGLAFGRDGSRLGTGGGFYDAALAQTAALRVGVAFAATLTAAVPSEPHDERLDAVVTEAGAEWVRHVGT